MKTTLEMQQIGVAGGGMIVDASQKTTLDLQQIAASTKSLLILKNASQKTIVELQQIAASGNNNVIFDLTD